MRFKKKVYIKSYNLADDNEKTDAMMQLSFIKQQPSRLIKKKEVIETTLTGIVLMTLEWLEYESAKKHKTSEQAFDCSIMALNTEQHAEASRLLTQSERGGIRILERREWGDMDGNPLMFILWEKLKKE